MADTLHADVDAGAGATERSVIWSSSNSQIASVSATGTVRGESQFGSAIITATSKADSSVKGIAVVTVIKGLLPPITWINGSYTGKGIADLQTCNLGSVVDAKATIAVDSAGHGTLKLENTTLGVTSVAPITASANGAAATYVGSGAVTIKGDQFSVVDVGSFSPIEIGEIQTLTSASCTMRYNFTFSR